MWSAETEILTVKKYNFALNFYASLLFNNFNDFRVYLHIYRHKQRNVMSCLAARNCYLSFLLVTIKDDLETCVERENSFYFIVSCVWQIYGMHSNQKNEKQFLFF